jgi:hypothetical protein
MSCDEGAEISCDIAERLGGNRKNLSMKVARGD